MIDNTITANKIVNSSQVITTIISGYILTNMPDYDEKKGRVFEEIKNIKQDIGILDTAIVDKQARKRLNEIKSLILEYEENLQQIYRTSENNELLETAEKKKKSLKISSWIQDTVISLISSELSYQQVAKADLHRKADWIGVLVYGIITLGSCLSIAYAIAFSNRVGGAISKLARTARKIAEGNLEVERFEVKSRDEVSILAESFNYMATEIKKSINEIEEKALVENKLKEQEIKNLEISNLLNKSELRFLQSQINPHFLFNTMNTIASMAKIQKAYDIKKMIESIADILRYNLKKIDGIVTLGEEYEVVKNYVFIQKMRFGDKNEYCFDVDPMVLNYKVLGMIFQPFVENAIIHGLEPKEDKGLMEFSIHEAEDNILIVIKDNGVGISEEVLRDIKSNRTELTSDSKMGIGMNNVIRRLELAYGRNVVDISSKIGEGTAVRITLDKQFNM